MISTIVSLFLAYNIYAQCVCQIDTNNLKLQIDPTTSVSVVDTGDRPNLIKLYSLVSNDSAVQTNAANRPRFDHLGTVRCIETTSSTKDQLIINNSIKNYFKKSFSLTVVVQPLNGAGAVGTFFGVVDGDNISFQTNGTDRKVLFKIQTGAKSVTVKTLNPVFISGEDFVPKMLTVVYDRTIKGVGGIKIYEGTVALALDPTFNGNTSTYTNDSLFNPASLGFGIGARNRTVVDQPFSGRIDGVLIYSRAIGNSELSAIEDYYTDTVTTSLYGLLNNTIEYWIAIGQSNNKEQVPASDSIPVKYRGIQWGTYTGSNNTIPNIINLKYATSTIWGSRYITWKELAEYRSKPVFHLQAAIGGTRLTFSTSVGNWNVENTADSGSTKALSFRLIDQSLYWDSICKAKIELMGHHPKLKGFTWLQGEAEAAMDTASANDYAHQFDLMRHHYRTKLNDSTLIFVIGNINVPTRPYTSIVRQQLINVSNLGTGIYQDSRTYIFATDDLGLQADLTHYSGAGVVPLGERYFNEVKNH